MFSFIVAFSDPDYIYSFDTLDAVVKAGYQAILSNYNAWYLVRILLLKKNY